MKWRITHAVEGGIEVVAPTTGYPSIGVTFEYDGLSLTAVVHALEVDDALHAADAIRESESQLRGLWAVLEFLRGGPLPRRSPRAQRILPPSPPGHLELQGTVMLTMAASVSITRSVRFPSEAAATGVHPRLLERANGARDEEDPAHALRDYYSILEELGAPRSDQLKHVRDFVSHGGPLRNRDLLAYVRTEIGDPSLDRYDPADPRHRGLVIRWRGLAATMVERELMARLQ